MSGSPDSASILSLPIVLKTMADNSETTRKNLETMVNLMRENSETTRKNTETMVKLMREWSIADHETGTDFQILTFHFY